MMSDVTPATATVVHVQKQDGIVLSKAVAILNFAVMILLAVSVTILTGVVGSWSRDSKEAQAVTNCRNLFAAQITNVQKERDDASANIVIELVHSIFDKPDASTPFDKTPTLAAIASRDEWKAKFDAAIAARNDWVAADSRLPCPLKAKEVADG